MAQITKFHLRHVKCQVEKIGSVNCAWNDGNVIIVSVGYGQTGKALAGKIVDHCSLQCDIVESKRPGSISDQARWQKQGVANIVFVQIRRPLGGPP